MIIFILDGSNKLTDEDINIMTTIGTRRSIALINKIDLGQQVSEEKLREYIPKAKIIKTAIKQGVGIDELEQEIVDMVYGGEVKQEESLLVTNVRHMELLEKAAGAVADAYRMAENMEPLDFIEVDVRRSWELLGEIIGEAVTEDIIDQVFARFCLGK